MKRFIVRYCKELPLIRRLIPFIQLESKKKFEGKDIPKIVGTRYGFKMHINKGDSSAGTYTFSAIMKVMCHIFFQKFSNKAAMLLI
jgi:hypothetical protein